MAPLFGPPCKPLDEDDKCRIAYGNGESERRRAFGEDDVRRPLSAVRSQWAVVLRKHLVLALGEEPNHAARVVAGGLRPTVQTPLHDDDWDVDDAEELGGAGLGEQARLMRLHVHLHRTVVHGLG